MLSGRRVLMQHFHPVKRLQAPGDLLDDAADGLEIGLGIVDHPLGQRLPLDELHRDVEVVALPRLRAGLQHMRAVDAAGDPFLHHEALEIGRVAAQVDRRDLQDHHRVVCRCRPRDRCGSGCCCAARGRSGSRRTPFAPRAAAAAAAPAPARTARSPRRAAPRRSARSGPSDCPGCRSGRPPRRSALAARSRSSALSLIVLAIEAGADMLVDAVGRQHEHIAGFDLEHPVVDLDLRIHAQRAAEIALLRRHATRWSSVSCSRALPATR